MQIPLNDIYGIIAQTLLHVGDMVLRVSGEKIITHIWGNGTLNDHIGKALDSLSVNPLFGAYLSKIHLSVATRTDASLGSSLRIISVAADTDGSYLVYNSAPSPSAQEVDQIWRDALDASSDGIWDLNMQTGYISFSRKWHQNFDSYFEPMNSAADWRSRMHPDDREISKENTQKYLDGKLSSYFGEFRHKCKDGTYKWLQSSGVLLSRTPDGKPLLAIGTHTDIDERKKAEQEHAATYQLLADLIENLQDGIIVVGDKDRLLFANKPFLEIYDIEGTPEDLIGTHISDNIVARSLKVKDPEYFIRRTKEIHEARQIVLNEEIELLNGKIYLRDYIPIPLGNNATGAIWKLRDITERKIAQRKYEEQRLFYEKILNSIPEDIAVHDRQHRYLFLNPAAIKDDTLRQYLIGKNHEDYFRYRNLPLSRADERNKRFEIVLREKRPYEWVEKIINREGQLSYHFRCLYPLLDDKGDVDLVIVYGANITERILTEQELKKSRDTFAKAFNNSGSGMALLTPEGKWLEVNNALCDMTGYSREELLELNFQDITHPADLAVDMVIVNQLLKNEIAHSTLEKRYISKSKKIIWVLLNVSLVRNEDGQPAFYITQITDITQRKELEAELNRKNAELEAAQISLVNKVNQMENLNHIIAHNLRGPAGNIKMLSDANEHSFDALDKAEILDLIHQSATSLIDSLNTLMEMMYIKRNKDITYDHCDIPEIISHITTQLQGSIYEKHIQINLSLAVTSIEYPRVYLESILYNLISNALKYSAPSRTPEITIATSTIDDHTVLSVKDNGLGIDLNKYEHKVFQLNQVFHPGPDSKGVGLFITKTQIESLGGTIIVKSEPDKGSEFIVTF